MKKKFSSTGGRTSIRIRQSKIFLILVSVFLCVSTVEIKAQKIAYKTNLAWWATLSPNAGAEIRLSRKYTLDAFFSYHPWKLSSSTSLRHWLVQPELRWWYCRSYEGSFWGVHALGGRFNVHALPLTGMSKDFEYTGSMAGGGISYGYHLLLARRWSLEFIFGAGYVMIDYDKYECGECREKVAEGRYNYIGPTRIGISLIYFIK